VSIGATKKERATNGSDRVGKIQEVLCEQGVYGGNCVIMEDVKRKRADGSFPHKPISLNGGMCCKLLEPAVWPQIVQYLGLDGTRSYQARAVWKAMADLIPYSKNTYLEDEEIAAYEKKISTFMSAYIDVFGCERVTRYLHLLYCQGGVLLRTYGAWAPWNAQGLEKSHFREKNFCTSKTSHGGGKGRLSQLWQLAHVSFRNMMHRANVQHCTCLAAQKGRTGNVFADMLALQRRLQDEEGRAAEAQQLLAMIEEQVCEGSIQYAHSGDDADEEVPLVFVSDDGDLPSDQVVVDD
jgi:hypothetical protein